MRVSEGVMCTGQGQGQGRGASLLQGVIFCGEGQS